MSEYRLMRYAATIFGVCVAIGILCAIAYSIG